MKTVWMSVASLALVLLINSSARAEEKKTLKGEAMCAKCELKEAKSCQAAIKVKEGDKSVIYYAENNKVAKDFHDNICTATVKVVATGEVSEKEGKKHIVLSKIELDKN